MFSVNDYKKIKSWQETYPTSEVILNFNNIHSSWNYFMKDIILSGDLVDIENKLSEQLKKNKNILPYPETIFWAFKFTSFNDLKVIIIGQDPYFKMEKGVPQGMGLSFSVPVGIEIPSSLDNIYKNMKKYNHISKDPDHGNLQFLANQGCLFLNTALTVAENEKNSHSEIWKQFTDSIIVKLSNEKNNLVFVLWGASAYEKYNLIDKKKHMIIVSSHPSGLSCHTPLKNYPAFNNSDHFGQINNYLNSKNIKKIIYGL